MIVQCVCLGAPRPDGRGRALPRRPEEARAPEPRPEAGRGPKRLARTAPVLCIVRTGGIAEEDSLAENVQRAPLHPLDQFRAFLALREKGQSEEDIAAAFFVSVAVVRQRLRLASVSPRLLEVYAEDGMSLDQLMAFTVNPDHARQEQVLCRYRHNTWLKATRRSRSQWRKCRAALARLANAGEPR